MEQDDDEENLLRSVALQNAQSILLARQRAEEELIRTKEWLRVTLASIGDAVITTDTAGCITSLNPVAERLTGWAQRDARGEPLERIFQIVNEHTRHSVENPALRALREGEIVGLANHTILIARDETERAIDDSAAPIKDEQGTIIGVVLVFRDVSERRKNEAALKESDRHKDEFLAMLAHELRNPLAPIRNGVQIFRALAPPVPELQLAIEMIDRQLHQLTRLVDDLLDMSRITRGKIELRKERVELATIVKGAIEASRPLIDQRDHELTVTIPPQPIHLEADLTRLSQVLMNLINNAAKFSDRAGRIWVTAERENDSVLIRVKDTGIGIPAEMLPRIFDMFTQVDRSLERSEGGLGIGLTLVHRLVEMHGGTVEARSEGPGKGSEFVVHLPVAVVIQDPGPQGKAGHGEAVVTPAARRILVVDDNLDAAESLGMLLGMLGHEVHTAHDGLEAIEAVAQFRPDVVLLDIGLPKLNGYEAARRIREQEGGTSLVLVALTGWGQEEDRRRSKEAGFDHHMTKPVDFADLQKVLAEVNRAARKDEEEVAEAAGQG
ncbi:MAG TPA: ATP-binding protein [Thermoanaerobaculia bacterium]|jgi:PAS domain S-box-containing protein|nr:ATP-binding protein [Thermoanaerobaculia bacterium]